MCVYTSFWSIHRLVVASLQKDTVLRKERHLIPSSSFPDKLEFLTFKVVTGRLSVHLEDSGATLALGVLSGIIQSREKFVWLDY